MTFVVLPSPAAPVAFAVLALVGAASAFGICFGYPSCGNTGTGTMAVWAHVVESPAHNPHISISVVPPHTPGWVRGCVNAIRKKKKLGNHTK